MTGLNYKLLRRSSTSMSVSSKPATPLLQPSFQTNNPPDSTEVLWGPEGCKSKAEFRAMARAVRTARERLAPNSNAAIAALRASQRKKPGTSPGFQLSTALLLV
jgi:hypothetical protein